MMIAGEKLGKFVSDAAGGAGDQDCGHADILPGPCSCGRLVHWLRKAVTETVGSKETGGSGKSEAQAQMRLMLRTRVALLRGADEGVRPYTSVMRGLIPLHRSSANWWRLSACR